MSSSNVERQYDNTYTKNHSAMIIENITHTKGEYAVTKDKHDLVLKMILLVILFLFSMVVNFIILLAFYRKQSLRTIRNRWVVTGMSDMLSMGILYTMSNRR